MGKILDKIFFWRKTPLKKIFSVFKRPKLIIPLLIIVVLGGLAAKAIINGQNSNAVADVPIAIKVKTVKLDLSKSQSDEITTVGTVKAETAIDVIALSGGTVRSLFFNTGDEVRQNQILARLKNDQAATSYSSAQTGFSNSLNSLEQTRRIADENIRQAELGVENALEAVQSAEIGLQTARDNLTNITNLQNESKEDQKQSAVIAFSDFVNTADNALEQVNYILDVDDEGIQLSGIDETLGVKDPVSLTKAEGAYLIARELYIQVYRLQPTVNTIEYDITQVIALLTQTRQTVDLTITVLDNTVTSLSFPDASLNAQKSSFSLLKSGLVAALNGAQQTLDGLNTVTLVNKQEMDTLENAVKAAENQLDLAQLGYANSLAALATAKQAKEQQLVASQSAVDAARGQRDVIGTQVADLAITSPISGKITSKTIEVGTEVNPGQKLATVAQTDIVKVEISLPSEDIYRIQLGQSVTIRNDLVGIISQIDPAADPITRKVRVEILFDNKDQELITGTFVDVIIPVDQLEKTHSDSFFIPLRSVAITQTEKYVFTVTTDTETGQLFARKTQVTTGPTQGALIEIIDGLINNDELIVEGNKSLEDGTLIEIDN
jgi:membrane fusion protein (multidrug efflux system)